MWRLKQFMPKEAARLEGRTLDIGNIKVLVREMISEGGFSCVYVARDLVNSSKQYALKHLIIQDKETMDLVTREIMVMKSLKGHPNVVTLVSDAIMDMGRTTEALLLMEFCEKSLVIVMENRGAGYFEEKKILLIFRDVCNAVFAMHCQSPPLAHRDLKAENILLGADGAWKLCDFGSVSNNHKCFDSPKEMGIEEDNIRKHTTPAYRAPEMWDLYRREVISEKVDIWALGCLLYKMCYLKLAFDGESKLQILNGNYHIPELPKYNPSITNLIKDMLNISPDPRPDITQVWFRVNELLPVELQKDLPETSPSASTFDVHPPKPNAHEEAPKTTPLAPRRSPPPPPSSQERTQGAAPSVRPLQASSKVGQSSGSVGSFWSSQYAQHSTVIEAKGPIFDEEPISHTTHKNTQGSRHSVNHPAKEPAQRNLHGSAVKGLSVDSCANFEASFSSNGLEFVLEKVKPINHEDKGNISNSAFNAFAADFGTSKTGSGSNVTRINSADVHGEEDLQAEVNSLREELKVANLEKEEITSKYEKLVTKCSSQRQEMHDLKCALAAARSSTPNKESKDSPRVAISHGGSQPEAALRDKNEGTLDELRDGFPSSPWAAFTDEPKVQSPAKSTHPRSVRTLRAGMANSNESLFRQPQAKPKTEAWAFDQDSFKAFPSASEIPKTLESPGNSQRFGARNGANGDSNQPSGWTGF